MMKGSWKEIYCGVLSHSRPRCLLSKIVGKWVLISNEERILQAKQTVRTQKGE